MKIIDDKNYLISLDLYDTMLLLVALERLKEQLDPYTKNIPHVLENPHALERLDETIKIFKRKVSKLQEY